MCLGGVHYFTYSDFKKPPKSGSGFHPHVPFEKLIHPDQNAQETDFQAGNISDNVTVGSMAVWS